jgi:hypothetical protein
MKPRVMKNGTVVSMLLVILLAGMVCATMGTAAGPLETARHKFFMRGQVLEVADGKAYLCLGSEEGAKVGQVFIVHRYVNIGGAARGGHYRIDYVGTVKITEVETHMAWAQIITGDVKANDVVDLKEAL